MKRFCYYKIILVIWFLSSSFFSFSQVSPKPCPCPAGCSSPCSCMKPDKLFLSDVRTHSTQVQSVAWCCDASSNPLAVIGGYSNPYSIRVYELDYLNGLLDEKAQTIHGGNYVYSVDCCCTSGQDCYIAMGGAADASDYDHDVRIYKYNSSGPSLDLITSFTHGNNVRAVSWLCDPSCVNATDNRYLAIGGDPVGSINIRILDFNPTNSTLTQIAQKIHGAPVYSVDWCTRTNQSPLLAIGGATSVFGCDATNIRVYVFECVTKILTELTNAQHGDVTSTGTVYSVKWCCDSDALYPYLAIGGTPVNQTLDSVTTYSINTQVYVFNALQCDLIKIATNQNQDCDAKSVDWNISCRCGYLTVGFGNCTGGTCTNNITVYRRNSMLEVVTQTKFDDNVNSLAWCKAPQDCYYLLVGTEVNDWATTSTTENEIALYKGLFCQPGITSPPGICSP